MAVTESMDVIIIRSLVYRITCIVYPNVSSHTYLHAAATTTLEKIIMMITVLAIVTFILRLYIYIYISEVPGYDLGRFINAHITALRF